MSPLPTTGIICFTLYQGFSAFFKPFINNQIQWHTSNQKKEEDTITFFSPNNIASSFIYTQCKTLACINATKADILRGTE